MQPQRLVERTTRADLVALTHMLAEFPAPWFVSGGWAIDAFLGRITREHADLEIGIARTDQAGIHSYLPDWDLYKIVDGGTPHAALVPWEQGDWLELPVFQIVAQHRGARPPEFEFFLNDVVDEEWRFRRNPAIRRPFRETYLMTDVGIPIIAPEIQLLYKARLHRPKDDHDLHAVLECLTSSQRSWLKEGITSRNPDHPWLAELEE